jgi:type II secretory pathway pseudopilin PulG
MKLSSLARRARATQGATLIEMLIALLVLGALLASALPSFLGQANEAIDYEAKSAIFHVHQEAHFQWTEDGNVYPATAQFLVELTPGEPAFIHRASLPDTSYSINPFEASINVDNEHSVTICSRSRRQIVFCARFNELRRLEVPEGFYAERPGPSLLARSIGVEPALASVFAPEGGKLVGYSRGTGTSAEQDALAALPTETSPPTCNAGPNNTGMPSWAEKFTCPADDPDPPPDDPPPPPPAPDIQITAAPSNPSIDPSPTISWDDSYGGPVSTRSCTLDGVALPLCLPPASLLAGLALGAHTFAVSVTGPGGSDSDSRSWQIVAGPGDRLSLNGIAGKATSLFPKALAPSGAFEVSAWVNLRQLPPPGGQATVISAGCARDGTAGCLAAGGYLFTIDSAGGLHFAYAGKGGLLGKLNSSAAPGTYTCSNPSGQDPIGLQIGKFNYIEAYLDASFQIRLYLNNKLQSCTAAATQPKFAIGSLLFTLGGALKSDLLGYDLYLNGTISSTRMTSGGAAAFTVTPGPTNSAVKMFTPAENNRPALFLFNFPDSTIDQIGALAPLTLVGGAVLSDRQ